MREQEDIFEQKSPMSGLQGCDVRKIQCRWCQHAKKGRLNLYNCEEYPDYDGKPSEVKFLNKTCPKFKQGKDLLPEDGLTKMQKKYGDINKWLKEAHTTMPAEYDPSKFEKVKLGTVWNPYLGKYIDYNEL